MQNFWTNSKNCKLISTELQNKKPYIKVVPLSADLFFAILFLVIYYIRPQDWVTGIVGANIVKPIVLLGLFSLLNRERTLTPGDIFKTPLDWAMFLYACYVALTSSDVMGTARAFAPLPIFYWLTVLALDSEEKLLLYMKWWTVMLLSLAGIGVAQVYGLDITGGQDDTDRFVGRLALGTWTHNNPNALAHSVVVAIPLVFFLMFWKSKTISRIYSVPLILLAGYAAIKTESKGAFLVGGGSIVLALTFGRPKIVQILIISAAFAGGGTVLAMLPRMEQMNSLGSDEGVIGRMMVWELARTSADKYTYGEGWKKFEAFIEWEGKMYPKACHSSFVRIGAELGYPGLYFFLLILWCNFRVLMSMKTDNLDLERSRRMLFLLLATYAASGWMIDRSYHTEYFLLAACCGAIHRLQLKQGKKLGELETENDGESMDADLDENSRPIIDVVYESSPEDLEKAPRFSLQRWHRLGFLDLGIAYILVLITLQTWDYLMENI